MIYLAVIAVLELAVIAWLALGRDRGQGALIDMADRMAQRVQAPDAAVLEHHQQHGGRPGSPTYAPPALVPDDDEGFWEARDDLANRLAQQELSELRSDDTA